MAAADLLAETEAAISACLQSQAYTVGERQQQRARLAELQSFRKELIAEVQAGGGCGRMATLGQIDRPS